MTTEGTAGNYVTSETLSRLVAELTVDDVRRARLEHTTEGDPMRGFASVYFAAKRLELHEGDSEEAFLARVRISDLAPLLADAAVTLPEGQSGTSSSPPSVASGA